MKSRMNKRVRKNNVIKLIQILLFTTIIVVCYSLSKFYRAQAGETTAILGKPIVTTNLQEIIIENLSPGQKQTYLFKVSNYEDNKISDVDMSYTIEIQSEKYLPLQFELKIVENGTSIGENLLKNNVTETIHMGIEKYEQEYELTILWDENEKNYQYSEEIDYVEILLNSYQANNT